MGFKPPRTPDAILRLRGSGRVSRKTGRRYDGKGIDAAPGRDDPPPSLKGEALKCWKETVAGLKELGLFATTDRNILRVYCETWARWLRNRGGLSIIAEFRRLSCELGLSPAARQRLKSDMKLPTDDAAKKKAAEYFGSG